MSSAKIENYDEFRTELLKRFFNPQSYFFLSLSTRLQDKSSVAEDVTDDDYLIIGQIVQHFIDSDDPGSELVSLNKLDRFDGFARKLDEGLRQLHQPGLRPEEMKNTIEGLANNLVQTIVEIIHNGNERKHLLEILGITLPERIQVSNNVRAESTSVSAGEIPQDVEDDSLLDENRMPADHFETEDVRPEEIGNQVKADNDSIPETIKEAETGSASEKQEHTIAEAPKPDLVNSDPHEPFGLKVGFYREANAAHNELKSIIARLKPGDVPRKELKTLKAIFLDLRESAMVHGFCELEEISYKSQKYLESLLKESLAFPESTIQLFQELPGIIKCALSESLDAENEKALRNFALRLTQEVTEPRGVDDDEALPLSDREEELVSDILNETLSEHFVEEVSQKEQEDHDLYMPGEDDPELLDLINEVTNRKTETCDTQDEGDDGPIFDRKQNIDLHDLQNDSSVLAPVAKTALVKDDRLANFRHEADLYFRVVDEAIEQLLSDRQSRIAFENLELAAYSLKGLARKLGLDPLARIPELVEELVGKIILLRIFPGNDTYLTIKKAFTLLKKTADINEVEKREYRELDRALLGLIQSLDGIESTQDGKETSGLGDSKESRNLNGMRMGTFQLRGRKSLPNRGK